jgi:hypothetical protein
MEDADEFFKKEDDDEIEFKEEEEEQLSDTLVETVNNFKEQKDTQVL